MVTNYDAFIVNSRNIVKQITGTIFKKKMHDEAQILYSSTNSISLKQPKHIGFIGFDMTCKTFHHT